MLERIKMIKPNLKVGDKFSDGNRVFEVLQVCGEGVYISKCVADSLEEIKTEETKVEEPKKAYTKTEINRMPNEKLEEMCNELGLELGTGTQMKKEIIEELGL